MSEDLKGFRVYFGACTCKLFLVVLQKMIFERSFDSSLFTWGLVGEGMDPSEYVSYSLNSLKGDYRGDHLGDHYKGY